MREKGQNGERAVVSVTRGTPKRKMKNEVKGSSDETGCRAGYLLCEGARGEAESTSGVGDFGMVMERDCWW